MGKLYEYTSFSEAIKMLTHDCYGEDTCYYFNSDNDSFRKLGGEPDDWKIWRIQGQDDLAEAMVLALVQSGLVKAYARNDKQNEPNDAGTMYQVIEPVLIKDTSCEWDSDRGGYMLYNGEASYYDIHIKTNEFIEVMGWWINRDEGVDSAEHKPVKEQSFKAIENVKTTAGAEAECLRWMQAIITKSKIILTKQDLWEDAKKEDFGNGLSWRGFVRTWEKAAPISWRAAGKRKQNRDGCND